MPHSPKHIPSRSYALDIPTVFVGAFSVRSSPFGAFARVGHTRFGRHRRADRRKLPSNMFGVSKVYNRVFHRPFSGYRLCVPNMPARLDDCNYLHNTATACGRRFVTSRRGRRSPPAGVHPPVVLPAASTLITTVRCVVFGAPTPPTGRAARWRGNLFLTVWLSPTGVCFSSPAYTAGHRFLQTPHAGRALSFLGDQERKQRSRRECDSPFPTSVGTENRTCPGRQPLPDK